MSGTERLTIHVDYDPDDGLVSVETVDRVARMHTVVTKQKIDANGVLDTLRIALGGWFKRQDAKKPVVIDLVPG